MDLGWTDLGKVAAIIAVLMLVWQWAFWIMGRGRYAKINFYPLNKLLQQVLNDFRHMLAAGVLFLFALSLTWSLLASHGEGVSALHAMQAVIGGFGSLTGAIVGFYFANPREASPPPELPNDK